MRFFLLIAVICLLVFLFRALKSYNKTNHQDKQARQKLKKFVPCQNCQLHIPIAEAIRYNNNYFCSDAHLQEWEKNNS